MSNNVPPTKYKLIGKNYTTPDLLAKVTGRSKYAEDYRADGMLFAKLLLSSCFRCQRRRRFGAAASTKRPPLRTSASYRCCNRCRRAGLRVLRRRPPDVHAAESRA